MKKLLIIACGLALTGATALAAQGPKNISENLDGYAEVPLALSTSGEGRFHARISNDGTRIAYELSYVATESDVTQAHIHFGSPSQAGGVSVFLCTNLANGPAGTQLCPDAPATIQGVIQAADVIGPVSQGIAAGEFNELVRAIRAGSTYVNVHTVNYPGGEIRAQIDRPGNRNNGNGNGSGNGHGNH
jgi:hypothetical protein